MPGSILGIWAAALVMGVLGVFLLVRAVGRGGWVSARKSSACGWCGYPSEGLELGICPECGRTHAHAAEEAARHRRIGMAAAGVGLIGLGALGYPAADAARFGLAHVMPTVVLLETLRWAPSAHSALSIELQERADSARMTAWERQELARVCSRLLAGGEDSPVRRTAAWLLTRVMDQAPEQTAVSMLADRDPVVRTRGVEALWRRHDGLSAASDRLLELALRDTNALVRKRAALVLCSLDNPADVSAALARFLDGPRRAAAGG